MAAFILGCLVGLVIGAIFGAVLMGLLLRAAEPPEQLTKQTGVRHFPD